MKPRTETQAERRVRQARWTSELANVGRAAKALAFALSRANKRPIAVASVEPYRFDKIDGTCPACGATDAELRRKDHPATWDVEVRDASVDSRAPLALWTPEQFRGACEAARAGRAPVLERREVAPAAAAPAIERPEPLPADVKAWMAEWKRTGVVPEPLKAA